ncbi:MAG: CZB domain-containing protein [Acidobacteriota bacterium]
MHFDREIKSAIGAHGLWRTHLLSAIKSGYSEYTPAQVRQEHLCSFGQWLETVEDPTVRDSPEFQNCVTVHRRFHAVTASVLKLAVSGKKEAAREAVDIGGEFANASMEFTTAMLHWSLSVPAPG